MAMVEKDIIKALAEMRQAVEKREPFINSISIKDIVCCCDMSDNKKVDCLSELYYYWRKLYGRDYFKIVELQENEICNTVHPDVANNWLYCDLLWPASSNAYDRWFKESKFSKMIG